jgi:hypothetical protein
MAFSTSAAITSHTAYPTCITDAIFGAVRNEMHLLAHTCPHATTRNLGLKVSRTAGLNAVPSLNEM